ncbi:MAG: hypothetical protein DCC58_17460 [Chloroflexi bacterium]|nr:MAG: hypothetical protein DCC58_17460 [Chloroflexota bacterium]
MLERRSNWSWQQLLLPALGLLAVAAAVAAAWALALGSPLPLLLAMALIGAVILVERPILSLQLVVFMFYVNLIPVLIRYHDVLPLVAMALPVVAITPLAARLLTDVSRPIWSATIRVDAAAGLMLVFLAVLIVSTLRARNMEAAFIWTADFVVSGLALYLIVVNTIRTREMLRYVIWAMLGAGAFLAAITIVQELTHSYSNAYGGFSPMMGSFLDGQSGIWRSRPSGPVADPNRYAQILLVLVPLGLFQARASRGWLRLVLAGMTLLIIGGVVLTYSRGAGVALMLILPLIALLWNVRPRTIILGGVVALLALYLIVPGFYDRLDTIRGVATLFNSDSSIEADRSMRSRLTKNLAALHMFTDHPVIGVGPDNYGEYSAEYADPVGSSVNIVGNKAHNLYLGLLSETGALGFLAFSAAVGVIASGLLRVRRTFADSDQELVDLANAFLLSMFAYALTAMFLHLSYQRYFWFLLALAGALLAIVREAVREQEIRRDPLPWATETAPPLNQPMLPTPPPNIRPGLAHANPQPQTRQFP